MVTCGFGLKRNRVLPFYEDHWHAFSFAANRLHCLFHPRDLKRGNYSTFSEVFPNLIKLVGFVGRNVASKT